MTVIAPRGPLPAGVRQTSGGTFNPDDPYTFFLASSPDAMLSIDYPTPLVAVNELKTPKSIETFEKLLDTGRKVFLDSGIFNLAMEHVRKHGTSHNDALAMAPEEIDGFQALWDHYGSIVTKYQDRLWGVVELDQGGVANKPRTRARIQDEFGITPIPVYHPLLDGWDYYDDLAKEYDRICFGNIVQAHPGLRVRLCYTAYERAKQYPYLWTHLLGQAPATSLLAMPMRGSADASTWLGPLRWQTNARTSAMLAPVATFPPDMWSHKGLQGEENYDRDKGIRMCRNTAWAAQQTLWGAHEMIREFEDVQA